MEHRAALLVGFPQAALQRLHSGAESALGRRGRPGLRDRRPTILRHDLWHRDQALPALNLPSSFRRDRKSTRLNSSHLVISYAVFCLKKKNLPENLPPTHHTSPP